MDTGYCLPCNGHCQHDAAIQITWGDSPDDVELYWTPQQEQLSIALSFHFPTDDLSAQKRKVLHKFIGSPLSSRSATSDFSFTSSQEDFSSSRTPTASITSLQSPPLSNAPTRNNSSQSRRGARARHHACAAHQQRKKKCDPVNCPDCPDRLNAPNPPVASPSSATPQWMGGMSPIGSQPRRTHSAPVHQRNPSARVGVVPNMASGPFQPPLQMLPSQNMRPLPNSPMSPYELGVPYQPITPFPLGGAFDQSFSNPDYTAEENSGYTALYTSDNLAGSAYAPPNTFTLSSAPPAWYYQPQMPTSMQTTQNYTLPTAPSDIVYDYNPTPNQNQNSREISAPAGDKEQVEQVVLLGLRKAFKGLLGALLARTFRVKVERLRKYM